MGRGQGGKGSQGQGCNVLYVVQHIALLVDYGGKILHDIVDVHHRSLNVSDSPISLLYLLRKVIYLRVVVVVVVVVAVAVVVVQQRNNINVEWLDAG